MVLATMAQLWWPLSPWLSPGAACFIFFNAVVAAIAVMSSSQSHVRQDQDRHDAPSSTSRTRLRRSASSMVLDHLRSFSLFSVHPVARGGVAVQALDDLADGVHDADHYCHCSQEAEVRQQAPQETDQVSAVVSDSETPWPTAPQDGESAGTAERSMASSAPAATAVAAAEPASAPEEEEEQSKSISMDEAYAMVQQRRPQQSQRAPAAASVSTTTTETATAATWPQRTRGDQVAKKGPKRPGRRRAEDEAPAELNARAELFIRQFREELKLQRINSLLRHAHALGPVDNSTPVAVSS